MRAKISHLAFKNAKSGNKEELLTIKLLAVIEVVIIRIEGYLSGFHQGLNCLK